MISLCYQKKKKTKSARATAAAAAAAADAAAASDEEEIDKLKINISPLKPSHKQTLTKHEERFLKRLALFIRERSIRITRLPMLGFKEGACDRWHL